MQPDVRARYLYDAVYVYMTLADELIRNGEDFTDANLLIRSAAYRVIESKYKIGICHDHYR